MKISIKNFGPIKSFDFDLDKDFHIIYGKNNIGKSYAISVVYMIIKSVLEMGNDMVAFTGLNPSLRSIDKRFYVLEEIENKINIAFSDGLGSVSIENEVYTLTKELLSGMLLIKLSQAFENSFSDSSNIQNRLTNENFEILISSRELSFSIELDDNGELYLSRIAMKEIFNVQFVQKEIKSTLLKNKFTFYANKNELTISVTSILQGMFNYSLDSILSIKKHLRLYVDSVYFLPASRSGLYEGLNIFSSVFAKLSQSRHLIKEKIDIPALSETMSDYFLSLSTINVSNSSEEDIYYKLGKKIENEILDAEILFNDDNKRIEYYSSKRKLKLNISETSSMVSEMAPIVAYLKYVVNESTKKDSVHKIIFIEEPEAHLHPEVQLKLIEIFAELISHKVKIVLTTHSNYIFNKVNNLILGGKLESSKVANYHIVNGKEGSYVAESRDVSEEGIEDENFVDVSEMLYNERLAILNQ